MKVLVADDDLVSRRMLQNHLQRQGYDVVTASNGTEAIAILLAPDGPRLAILDWVMPNEDGLSVCRIVREQATSYVYVVLLTSKDGKEDMATAFDAGVDDFLTKPFEPVETRARLRSGERVLALQEHLLQAQAQLRQQATHDYLTGLWNRGMAREQLEIELRRARRAAVPLAVVMADVDHFKAINDRYGHGAGDDVLREVATRIRSALRTSDGVGRWGGEEFLLLLPESDGTGCMDVAERVRAEVGASPVIVGEHSILVTLSMGVATTADHADADAVIAAADAALYRAKAAGRNRVQG